MKNKNIKEPTSEINKKLSLKKKNEGKVFENLIRKNAKEDDLYYLRLQDNLKFGGKIEGARFSQKSPYDGILFSAPYLFCLELKSSGATSLSYGSKPSCNIKEHQASSLYEASQYENVIAGFLIQFRPRDTKKTHREETTFFIDINVFLEFMTNKKSISLNECLAIGIEVPKTNVGKRVIKYKYEIKEMTNKIISNKTGHFN